MVKGCDQGHAPWKSGFAVQIRDIITKCLVTGILLYISHLFVSSFYDLPPQNDASQLRAAQRL